MNWVEREEIPMKKNYEIPEIEIYVMGTEDVITGSTIAIGDDNYINDPFDL